MSTKNRVQQAAVRVIASELDRRTGGVERAITDVAAHQQAITAEQGGVIDELRRQMATVQTQLGDIQQTQARLGRSIDELAARMRAREADADLGDAAIRGLQDELLAVQEQIARVSVL
jgi:chromosome segregation ATPase